MEKLDRVEIKKVKEALFYLKADLEWLNRKLNDQRARDFQAWVDELDYGVPRNIAKDVAEYQKEMKPYFAGLEKIKADLEAEIQAIETAISRAEIEVSERARAYLREEEEEEDEAEREAETR